MNTFGTVTGAGRRRIRPKGRDWVCPTCGRLLKYYWKLCPKDGTKRGD